jgi:hypothetical protein
MSSKSDGEIGALPRWYATHSATLRTEQLRRSPESHMTRLNSATASLKEGEEASLPVTIATSTAENRERRLPSSVFAQRHHGGGVRKRRLHHPWAYAPASNSSMAAVRRFCAPAASPVARNSRSIASHASPIRNRIEPSQPGLPCPSLISVIVKS